MAAFQSSVMINAPVENIEAYARYAESWPEWFPGVVAVATDSSYPEIGSNARVTFSAAGVNFDLNLRVLDYVFGQGVSYEISGMANGGMSFNLTPDGGAHWVTANLDYELPGGVLGQVADKMMVERMVQQNVEGALANMQAALG